MDMQPEVLSSRVAFDGRVFRVRTDEVRYPDGHTYRLDVIEHPGSYAVIAKPSPREIVLVRQYRHAAGRSLWEIPAGRCEDNEDLAAGARRELREETGYNALRMTYMTSMWMTPGFCDERLHFFFAEGLIAGEQQLDDDERIDVRIFTIEEAWLLAGRGEIADAKTLLSLAFSDLPKHQLPGLT